MKRLLLMLLASLFFFTPVNIAKATETNVTKPLKLAFLSELETLPVWYAMEKGMDKEAGYDFDVRLYPTGKSLIDSISTDVWNIGATGIIPSLEALSKKEISIIAVGADETRVNEIYAHSTNPLFSAIGVNQEYPQVYGSADLMRGKTILCPLGTNSHQLLIKWLDIFGLKDTDVTIVDTKPHETLDAFTKGKGDVVLLWAPENYKAKELGLKLVANAMDCDRIFKTTLFAKNDFLKTNTKQVQDFLRIYLEAVNEIQDLSLNDAATLYQSLQQKYASNAISFASAKRTIQEQRLYNKEQQLYSLKDKNSSFNQALQGNIDFYLYVNDLPTEQADYLKGAGYLLYDF